MAQQTSVFDAKLEIQNGGIKEKWSEKEVVARQKPLSSLRIRINVCLRVLSITEIQIFEATSSACLTGPGTSGIHWYLEICKEDLTTGNNYCKINFVLAEAVQTCFVI